MHVEKNLHTGKRSQSCKYRILADEILAWNGLEDSSHMQDWGMGRRLDTRYGNVKMEWKIPGLQSPMS